MASLPTPASLWAKVPVVTPERYRKVTLFALWSLVFIVLTGAGVRLTGSGLGCTDWPRCTEERLVAPLDDVHGMIEQVNRYITGLVSVAVILAVLGSLKLARRRRDLIWLSWGLVAGVAGQAVLGGLVVLFDLNPVLVQGHFVLSMVLVADALVLHHRAGEREGPRRPQVTPLVKRLGWTLLALATVVILTGTVVTGSGPHAGDEEAKRLPLSVHTAAQVHGIALWLLLASVVTVMVLARRERVPERVAHDLQRLLFVIVFQGAVGYTQYFTGIPPLLVGLHILGASLVWMAVCWMVLGLSVPVDGPPDLPHDDDGAGRNLVAQR